MPHVLFRLDPKRENQRKSKKLMGGKTNQEVAKTK